MSDNRFMSPHHPKPLTARQDPLNYSSKREASVGPWVLQAKQGRDLHLGLPIFSRLLYCKSMSHDSLEDPAAEALARACDHSRVPWLGSRGDVATESTWRIQSIGVGEPIDSQLLQSAAAIQLQLFGEWSSTTGSRRGNLHHGFSASQFAAWKPGLPVELASYEHLRLKLNAIRACQLQGKPVGAALIANPLTIYEDVRFLIDAGVDWLEIVQAPQYSLKAEAFLELADLASVLPKAVKAKRDAKAVNCPLWVTTSSPNPRDLVRLLEQGIEGLCIDSYLASRVPAPIVPRDTLAGIRVPAAGGGRTDYSWITSAITELQFFLRDAILFQS